MIQNIVSRVLIWFVAHAGVIPRDRIHSTFWLCFFGKCCKPFCFPGQLEDEATKLGPGILYCLHFFSAQQQGRILLSEEVFILLRVSVAVITATYMEKVLLLWEKSVMESSKDWCWEPVSFNAFWGGECWKFTEWWRQWLRWRTLIQETPQSETHEVLAETGRITLKQVKLFCTVMNFWQFLVPLRRHQQAQKQVKKIHRDHFHRY